MDKIEELMLLIEEFIAARSWQKYHKPKNLAMSISIEAAELMELYQWISIKTSMERVDDEIFMEKVKDELADIFIYALSFARITGIDISQAIKDKLQRNETRFPVDKEYHY